MGAVPAVPFPVIRVDGEPFERGVAYGEQASVRIALSLAFYERAFLRTGGRSLGAVCDSVIGNEHGWRVLAPDLMREIDGIAVGSGRSLSEILALNARDTFMHRRRPMDFDDGCTSVAVLSGASSDGHVWSGQNWDYHPEIVPSIVLLHATSDAEPARLTIVEAGQLSRQGANASGISLQANGLPSERRDESALPGPIVRRRIVGSSSMTEAIANALATPRAGRSNLLLTSREDRFVNIEAGYDSSTIAHGERVHRIAHANHFQLGRPADLPDDHRPHHESIIRASTANAMLDAAHQAGGIGAPDLATLLRSHADPRGPICDHGRTDPDGAEPSEPWMTVAATLTDLTEGVMHVAAGPPCVHPFVAIDIATGNLGPSDVLAAEPARSYPVG
jgi:isopenicillin-N N-acyltransferase-like protein